MFSIRPGFKQSCQHEVGELEFHDRCQNKSDQIIEAVNQTTNVATIVQEAICLSQCHLLEPVDLQMHASELPFPVWILD